MSWFTITDEELKFNHKLILEAIDEVMKGNQNVTTIHDITMGVIKRGIYITNDLVVECLIEKNMLERGIEAYNYTTKPVESHYKGGKDLVEEMKKRQCLLHCIEKELNKRFVFSDGSCDISLHDEKVCIESRYQGDFVTDIHLPLNIFKAICHWYCKKLNL